MFYKDKSGPRKPYFLKMQSALREAGITQPTLVLDRWRLQQNIDQLRDDLPTDMKLRLVAKSLPVPSLLKLASDQLNTHSYMTFNLPMLASVADMDPKADQLLGKPLPVSAAAAFYSNKGPKSGAAVVHWLIDSETRLKDYAELAKARSLSLNIVLELDVGLHRGGFLPGEDLARVLNEIAENPALTLSGFMGYEAHVAKAPGFLGLRDKALERAWSAYREALDQAKRTLGMDATGLPVRNAAGSPTFRLYETAEIANEVSVGSALVKPSDFDTDLLSAYAPALFLATPALKVDGAMKTPIIEKLDPVKRFFNRNLDRTIFIHGGYWKAKPVDPPGLCYNTTYGRSSNQDLLTGGPKTDISPDDFIFLRPTQSEAVLMQFGDVAIYEQGSIVDMWSSFPTSV